MRFQRQAMGQSWVRHARSRLFVPESAGGGGGFNPADYGADFSWWAGRLESYTNGQNVTTWTDRGSGTRNVTAGVGQEPTFYTSADPVSPNGQPFLRWANGDRLLNATPVGTSPWTCAVVFRPTSIPSTNAPVIGGTATVGTRSIRLRSTSGGQAVVYANATSIISGYNPVSPVGWQVVVCTFIASGATQRVLVFKSGLGIAPSPNDYIDTTYGAGAVVDSLGFALGGNTYVGEIAEAVLWRSDMSNANKILIGKALSDLYGVTY